jgi:hypothetical protein
MTANDKKRYAAPELTAVAIDREITLVMATQPPDHPGGPLGAPAAGSPAESGKSTLRSASPFGASSPDYSNMRK